jgi:hypothetical protein
MGALIRSFAAHPLPCQVEACMSRHIVAVVAVV